MTAEKAPFEGTVMVDPLPAVEQTRRRIVSAIGDPDVVYPREECSLGILPDRTTHAAAAVGSISRCRAPLPEETAANSAEKQKARKDALAAYSERERKRKECNAKRRQRWERGYRDVSSDEETEPEPEEDEGTRGDDDDDLSRPPRELTLPPPPPPPTGGPRSAPVTQSSGSRGPRERGPAQDARATVTAERECRERDRRGCEPARADSARRQEPSAQGGGSRGEQPRLQGEGSQRAPRSPTGEGTSRSAGASRWELPSTSSGMGTRPSDSSPVAGAQQMAVRRSEERAPSVPRPENRGARPAEQPIAAAQAEAPIEGREGCH
ncbi:hypothetical protein BS78_K261300 [Paspalum vaginatum]|uniref:Uncharacterized protein n=1 Tax=Paspalum vaginatum TaxID=158149 RepID=A0A9W7XDJ2_9POAL|nr:hypothetical protein BS78_K261300 [Paspalum vaginatum]